MLFSTPTFLFVFLPLSIMIYYASGRRNGIFLALSLGFYAWGEPIFLALLFASAMLNYGLGVLIGVAKSQRHRQAALTLGVVCNLSILIFFKYLNFIITNVNVALHEIGSGTLRNLEVSLPLAVSFFTFHAISYLVDVYRGDVAFERSPTRFALYIAMFPHLIAGPIVRFAHIAAALREPQTSWPDFAEGVRRFVIGLAKKVIIADTLALPVDQIFKIPADHLSIATSGYAVVLFTFQIYFDFSGYSDMAIGLARMFGYRFHENFDRPYTATSIREFWRRWHISLSTWFRDYVYRPLGGNRRGDGHTLVNLFVVFVLCGLWHGATWNFVIWGAYHGLFLMLERTGFGRLVAGLPACAQHLYMMTTVTFGWLIFRSSDLGQLKAFLAALSGAGGWDDPIYPIMPYADNFVLLVVAIAVIASFDPALTIGRRVVARVPARKHPAITACLEVGSLLVAFVMSVAVMATHTHKAFIYFRF